MLRHRGREYRMGDVVWTVDPFEHGTDVARMFAIVSTRTHPFEGQQFVGAGVTTTGHQVAHVAGVVLELRWNAGAVVPAPAVDSHAPGVEHSGPIGIRCDH
jgi:hypothetical protein